MVSISPPAASRDFLAEESFVTARATNTADLLGWLERERCDAVEANYGDPEVDLMVAARARVKINVICAELGRRERVARRDAGVTSPRDRRFTAITALAGQLREKVSVPEALEMLGWPMVKVGRDGSGRDEYAGACPMCGEGRDRFRAWNLPRSRGFCRRCDWRGDVISLWMNAEGMGFADAVQDLAHRSGIPIENDSRGSRPLRGGARGESFSEDRPINSAPLRHSGHKVAAAEIRHGRVAAR